MNYYERHIGDYLKDTAHLSLLEHGVYGRLLDVYYTREAALPDAQVARLIGARSKEELAAMRAILTEFFVRDETGDWIQQRCELEIERYQDKQRKASASANARWSKAKPHTERNANAQPNAMRTHSEGNAPNHQTPDTRPKESASALSARAPGEGVGTGEGQPSAAGLACRAIKAAGITDVNPGHPLLLRLLAAGVTAQVLADTAAELAGKGKAKFALLLATVEGRLRDAAAAGAVPAGAPPADPWTTRAGVEGIASTLGLPKWDECETFDAYRGKVRRAHQQRNPQPEGAVQ